MDSAFSKSIRAAIINKVIFFHYLPDIYLHRDTLIYSNDGLKIDLITVSSRIGLTEKKETTLLGLYPDKTQSRAKIFKNKKVSKNRLFILIYSILAIFFLIRVN